MARQKEFVKEVERTAKTGTYGPLGTAIAREATKNKLASCLLVDASGNDFWMNKMWKFGSGFWGFDIIIEETASFEHAICELKLELDTRIRELQFWYPGSDGRVCWGRTALAKTTWACFARWLGALCPTDGSCFVAAALRRQPSASDSCTGARPFLPCSGKAAFKLIVLAQQKVGAIQNGLYLWDEEEQFWRVREHGHGACG
eukprot:CAMPEP_0196745896 /NCGR_PEP_ID=MMETSP1091-20130531/63577_1 /TAXON_ID=302021 /ORGANISM="Rhodomonas sp., Strain CCMP768" /LENGTH=201 /DNA_ID=CAMNT_0042092755 /DNA_START=177 /DNA_END=782 /DNA_ORIENTATION=+